MSIEVFGEGNNTVKKAVTGLKEDIYKDVIKSEERIFLEISIMKHDLPILLRKINHHKVNLSFITFEEMSNWLAKQGYLWK